MATIVINGRGVMKDDRSAMEIVAEINSQSAPTFVRVGNPAVWVNVDLIVSVSDGD